MARGGLALAWVDVFTDRSFGGNPLAVVLDADELAADEMQALAAEFGISETIFVLDDATRLRIFTPRLELPLAGHPVVGASLELARRGRIPAEGGWIFRTGVGETPVEVAGGVATMTQAAPEVSEPGIGAAEAAALLGLSKDDVVGEPAVCSTGIPFLFTQVRSREALARVEADQAGIAALPDPLLGMDAWHDAGDGTLAVRMFGPKAGIAEDPATGAAAGALAALRVHRGAAPGRVTISQGEEIRRPSTIFAEVGGVPGEPEEVRVGGRSVLVFEGTLAAGVP